MLVYDYTIHSNHNTCTILLLMLVIIDLIIECTNLRLDDSIANRCYK